MSSSYFSMRCGWGPLGWILLMLPHWKNSPRIDTSPYPDTLSWIRAKQFLRCYINIIKIYPSRSDWGGYSLRFWITVVFIFVDNITINTGLARVYHITFEWVSDCCLISSQQFFSYLMARTSYFSMRCGWGPFGWIFLMLPHWKNSPRIDTSPYPDTLSWKLSNNHSLNQM
jgi:hypothetical protein